MTAPHYVDDSVTVYHGDSLEVLRELADASVDAVVCDPPYALGFMGREWDSFGDVGRGAQARVQRSAEVTPNGQRHSTSAGPYLASGVDSLRSAGLPFQRWCEAWSRECLRVLKPGGHMLAFGGTRTWHRLACAVEDAGFEIRDSIAWLYGSGFPKSLDVSKAIDRAAGAEREVIGVRPDFAARANRERVGVSWADASVKDGSFSNPETVGQITAPATDAARVWQGWGTALKPAFEPVVVARKPLAGTVAANVLEWGCGAINVGGCRVGSSGSSQEGGGGEAGTRGCPVHGLRGLRQDGPEGSVGRGATAVAEHVQSIVQGQTDARAGESELAGRLLGGQAFGLSVHGDIEPVSGGQGAPADTAAEGMSGTSSGDGAHVGSPTARGRTGPSSERRKDGQPSRESAPDELGGTLSGASQDRTGTSAAPGGERTLAGCTCREGLTAAGRWPANVTLDDTQATELDRQTGTLSSGANPTRRGSDKFRDAYGEFAGQEECTPARGADSGGSRFFPTFKYEAKAPTAERPRAGEVCHPTVKPLDLMRWLVRLVCPPGGVVLDPFAGSGTTAEACVLEGFRCVTVEREADYLPLIVARLSKPLQPGLGLDFGDGAA